MTNDSKALVQQDAADAQREQAKSARKSLLDFGGGIPWPWQAMTDVYGKINKGTVHTVAAPSGNGKTTFAMSLALQLIDAGVSVVYGAFERSVEDSRKYAAAMSLGLHPGRVLSGRWEDDDDFRSQFNAVDERLVEMQSGAMPWNKLHFVTHDYVSASAIRDMAMVASAHDTGAGSVNLVDHADHLGEGRADAIRSSVGVLTEIHRTAKEMGVRWVVFKQVNNRELNKAGTVLPRHRPIPVSAIALGQYAEEVSWTVSCLYQPLRLDVTADELKAVNEGRAELKSVLWEGVSCLALLKDRDMGQAGKKVLLGWDNGRITDAPDGVRLAVEAKLHGIKTNGSY